MLCNCLRVNRDGDSVFVEEKWTNDTAHASLVIALQTVTWVVVRYRSFCLLKRFYQSERFRRVFIAESFISACMHCKWKRCVLTRSTSHSGYWWLKQHTAESELAPLVPVCRAPSTPTIMTHQNKSTPVLLAASSIMIRVKCVFKRLLWIFQKILDWHTAKSTRVFDGLMFFQSTLLINFFFTVHVYLYTFYCSNYNA